MPCAYFENFWQAIDEAISRKGFQLVWVCGCVSVCMCCVCVCVCEMRVPGASSACGFVVCG